MKYIVFFALFIFLILPSKAQQNTVLNGDDKLRESYMYQNKPLTNNFNKVEKRIEQLLKEYHAAGLSVAVVQDGKLVYANGFGYRDYEKKLPADENTIYGIGSVTKSFTASVLGVLEGKGKINLNDSPIKYIPELRFYNKDMDKAIKLRHMLNHTTGISNLSSECSAVLFVSNSPKDLVPRLAYLKPSALVGERLMYNNYIYTVTGMIGEHVTGKQWEENLDEMLFKPLNMKHTYSNFRKAIEHRNFSFGYAVDSIKPMRVLPEIVPTRAPAGAIFSTVKDMSKWLQVFMNKGTINGKKVIPARYISEATKPQILFSGNENDSLNPASYYGYGWLVRNFHGMKRVEHSGGVSGYGSNVVFFPEKKLGIVVLTNQTTSSLSFAVTDLLINKLLNIHSKLPEVQFSQIQKIKDPNTPTVNNTNSKLSKTLKEFVGKYAHSGFGEISIVLDEKTLYADFPLTRFRLTHKEHNTFVDHFTKEIPLMMWNFMQFNFLEDDNGEINSLSLNFDSDPVIFKRIHK